MKKRVVSTVIFMLVCVGSYADGMSKEPPAPRGELRIVDRHPWNWVWITMNIMEHLVEFDPQGQLVPRLSTRWRWLDAHTLEFTLRQGVRFHNGEVFDAEVVKLNWEENTRLRQTHALGTYMNFKPGSRLEILDPYTVRFVFPEPDGGALAKISVMHMASRQFYREFGWGETHW